MKHAELYGAENFKPDSTKPDRCSIETDSYISNLKLENNCSELIQHIDIDILPDARWIELELR